VRLTRSCSTSSTRARMSFTAYTPRRLLTCSGSAGDTCTMAATVASHGDAACARARARVQSDTCAVAQKMTVIRMIILVLKKESPLRFRLLLFVRFFLARATVPRLPVAASFPLRCPIMRERRGMNRRSMLSRSRAFRGIRWWFLLTRDRLER